MTVGRTERLYPLQDTNNQFKGESGNYIANYTTTISDPSVINVHFVPTGTGSDTQNTYGYFEVTLLKKGVSTIETKVVVSGSWYLANYIITVVDVTSITIPSTLTLNKEDEYRLQPIIQDPRASTSLKWTSSNPEIATITNPTWQNYVQVEEGGKIHAIKSGVTTIKCENTYNGVYATCLVTVEPTHVDSVTLSLQELNLELYQNSTISATVFPNDAENKKITWQSTNSNIVLVNSKGEVTGISPGSVMIIARSDDKPDIFATCKVNVFEPKIYVTNLTLSSDNLNLKIGEQIILSANIIPLNATNKKLLWSSSDVSVASVDDSGMVTAIKSGKTIVSAKTLDGSNLEAKCEVTVSQPDETKSELVISLVLEKGGSIRLVALIPSQDSTSLPVSWNSSNIDCVTIDQTGLVNALSEGMVIITAKDANGNSEATCVVTVIESASIGSVLNDNDTEVEVYDMNGLRISKSIDELSSGVYIIKRGSIVNKIVVQ